MAICNRNLSRSPVKLPSPVQLPSPAHPFHRYLSIRHLRFSVALIVLACFAITFIYPLVSIFSKTANFGSVTLSFPEIAQLLLTTIGLAALGTLASAAIGFPLAKLFYCSEFPGSALLRGVANSSFFIPTIVIGLALHQWAGNLPAIVFALTFFNYSLMMRLVGTKWQTLDPRYSEVAATLGTSRWRIFFTITLPFLKSSLLSASAVIFLFCSTSFGVVLLLGGRTFQTLETAIYFQTNYQLNLQNAAWLTALQILLLIGIIAITQRQPKTPNFSKGLYLTRSPLWQRILGSFTIIFISLAPLIHLLVASRFDWITAIQNAFSVNKYLGISLFQAFGNSLINGCIATLLCVSVCCALTFARSNWLNQLITVPLGISSVVLGYGLLISFRTAFWIIPVAQSLVAIPIVVRTIAPILNSVDPKYSEIAAMLQVGAVQRFRKLLWPLVRLAVTVGCGLSLAISIGEFGATSFLVRPNSPTLPVAIYRLLSVPGQENFHLALIGAVILALFTIILVLVTEKHLSRFNNSLTDVKQSDHRSHYQRDHQSNRQHDHQSNQQSNHRSGHANR